MSSPFLTIPRARSMIWPGSQQTMGELLDQDKLTCKMLRQAFAKAENEQVRKAAEVLLVDRERKIREYIDGGNSPGILTRRSLSRSRTTAAGRLLGNCGTGITAAWIGTGCKVS